MDIEDLTDDELIEELLLRDSDADETTSAALVAQAIEAAGGDERKALEALEAQRAALVERAMAALAPLRTEATVIFASDELLERLEPDPS